MPVVFMIEIVYIQCKIKIGKQSCCFINRLHMGCKHKHNNNYVTINMYKQINNCSYIILNWHGLLFIAIYVYNVLNIPC